MNDRARYWLSPLLRGVFLAFLILNLIISIMESGALFLPGTALPQEYSETQIIRGLFLLGHIFFIWLLARAYEKVWVYPLTLTWLISSLLIRQESLCNLMDGARSFTPLIVFVLLMLWGLVFLFQRSGIRGRILLVCLLSSLLPMAFLGLGFYQQTNLLMAYAHQPMTRNTLMRAARYVDYSIAEAMSRNLMVLLEPSTEGGTIKATDPAGIISRARNLKIPIRRCEITPFEGPAERLTLDLANASLEAVLRIISQKFKLSLNIQNPDLVRQKISLYLRDVDLDGMLEQLNRVPSIKVALDGDSLVVTQASEIPVLSNQASGSHSAISRFEKTNLRTLARSRTHPPLGENPKASGYAQIIAASSSPILFLAIPHRRDGHIDKVTEVEIDFNSWFASLTADLDFERLPHTSLLFPLTPETMQTSVGSGSLLYRIERQAPLPSVSEYPQLKTSSPIFWAPRIEFDVKIPNPKLHQIGAEQDLVIQKEGEEARILQWWFLPRCGVYVGFTVSASHIRSLLLKEQWKMVAFAFLALALSGLMSLLYSERLSYPIERITEAARHIRDGETNTPIPLPADSDEIRELAETLSLMAEQLNGRISLANHRLLEEKGRFETLVESTWEGILLLSPAGEIVYANHAGRQVLGEPPTGSSFLTALRAVGRSFQPALPDIWSVDLQEVRAQFHLPSGSQGNTKILALYIRSTRLSTSESDSLSGYIAVLRDITIEREMDRMKNDFVSQVSHELRTPLTSIKAYTEMLLDDEADDPESTREYLNIINDEAERLSRLINDLLDIARIESGKRNLRPALIDLGKLTGEIVDILAAQAEKKNQKLLARIPGERLELTADPDLLKQAGLNLLNNAIKYTAEGGTLEVSLEADSEERLLWKFRDSGIGMTQKELDRLFTKFFRADSEFVRAAGGTGLGLTLVKNIIELHQGQITVESRYGEGSLFTVLLPRRLILPTDPDTETPRQA